MTVQYHQSAGHSIYFSATSQMMVAATICIHYQRKRVERTWALGLIAFVDCRTFWVRVERERGGRSAARRTESRSGIRGVLRRCRRHSRGRSPQRRDGGGKRRRENGRGRKGGNRKGRKGHQSRAGFVLDKSRTTEGQFSRRIRGFNYLEAAVRLIAARV